MKKLIVQTFIVIFLLLGGLYLAAPSLASPGELRTFKLEKGRSAQFHFHDMDMDVPADADEDEISVQEVDTDLSNINVPPGFKAIRTFRFGPHGAQFRNPIKARLKIDVSQVPSGYTLDDVRLYYINREEKRLEIVPGQFFSKEDGRIIAPLRHFSDYTAGVSGGWDGNGINPFVDYINTEDSHVNLYTRKHFSLLPILDSLGKGMNTELNVLYSTDTHKWEFPQFRFVFYDLDNGSLQFPNGATYFVPAKNSKKAQIKSDGKDGIPMLLNYNNPMIADYYLSEIIFQDGTKVSLSEGANFSLSSVTDTNGNQIKYNNTLVYSYTYITYIGKEKGEVLHEVDCFRLTSIVDSAGRTFYFRYLINTTTNTVTFQKIEQLLSDGSYKTILSYTHSGNTDIFTDSLGRATKYTSDGYIYYPNGSSIKLTYGSEKDKNGTSRTVLQKEEFYQPNQTSPFRTITYTGTALSYTEVNDGISRTKYTFDDQGNTTKVEAYTQNGQLLKTTTYSGYNCRHPGSVSTQYATNGVLGTAATTQYEYDDWLNTVWHRDPDGLCQYK